MSTALESSVVTVQAVLNTEHKPSLGILTVDKRLENEAKRKVQERIREEKKANGSRGFLEAEQKKIGDKATVERCVDRSIGTERGVDGKKVRTGSERARYKTALKQAEKARVYVSEGGYDKLKALNPTAAKEVLKTVAEVVKTWPDAKDLLEGLEAANPGDAEKAIEGLLRNPEYAAKVKAAFERVLSNPKIEDEISDLRNKFQEAESKLNAKKAELAANATEKTTNGTELKKFETDAAGDGPKLAELKTLETEMPALQADLESKQDELSNANRAIKALTDQKINLAARGIIDPAKLDLINEQVESYKKEATDLRKKITETNAKIQRKAELEKERANLQKRDKELDEAKTKLQEEADNLTRESLKAKADFQEAQMDRDDLEQQFVDSLSGVFDEATIQYLEEKITETETTQAKLIEEQKTKAATEMEKNVYDALGIRYSKLEKKGKHFTTVNNSTNINNDFDLLIRTGDPKEVLRNVMLSAGIPVTEIDQKLVDSAFVEKFQPMLVEKLLTKKQEISGKFGESEAEKIINSPWGAGMIEKLSQGNPGVKQKIEEARANGLIGKDEGIIDLLKRKGNKNILLYLLAILGGLAAGTVPLVMNQP